MNKSTKNIWLPYTQMQWPKITPPKVVYADGVNINLEDGTSVIDGISSWWSMCHGYQHPEIISAIKQQADQLSHIMFANFAHDPAYILAQRLAKLTKLERVFFSDSGSTAVEVALKMSIQYWVNKGQKSRSKFICFRNSYHGDTMGCMSVSEPSGMHNVFGNYMPKQYVIDIPNDEYSFSEFDELLASIKHKVAALIMEPLVQCAGGMKFHSADTLAEIHRICKKYDIIFIADEIATGFMRTGNMFACDEAGIIPDIMCVGKALTGGHIGLAATIASDEIFDGFLSEKLEHALMHGPTFMANPIACAAANSSLDIFEKVNYHALVENIEQQVQQELLSLQSHENVKNIRIKGAIAVIQFHKISWDEIFKMRQQFINKGVFLRPFADVVYIMPALNIKKYELSKITDIVHLVISNS